MKKRSFLNYQVKNMSNGCYPPMKKRKIVSVDAQTQSIIFSLPKDVWRVNICFYLSKQDLMDLRQVCRWFRKEVVSGFPVWNQMIPIDKVRAYRENCTKLGWDYNFQICVFSSTLSCDLLQLLPSSVHTLDLTRCEGAITEDHVRHFPASLKNLFLSMLPHSHPEMIASQALVFATLFNLFPDLDLSLNEFGSLFSILFWACANSHFETVGFLLEKRNQRKSIDQRNGDFGVTALYAACLNGVKPIVELLLKGGADPNKQRSSDGLSPLIIATSCKHVEIVSTLLQYGANPDYKDSNGKMAIDYAEQNETLKSILKSPEKNNN